MATYGGDGTRTSKTMYTGMIRLREGRKGCPLFVRGEVAKINDRLKQKPAYGSTYCTRVGLCQPFFLHFLLAEEDKKSYLCITYENGI